MQRTNAGNRIKGKSDLSNRGCICH
jgi:hypothetical protein